MDKKIGPSDMDLNQEKLIVVQDELRRLQYDMKKKELNRNTAHAKMQQCIRLQWETISELKKQYSELTLQLRVQESESFANQANRNLKQFKKCLGDAVDMERRMQEQTEEVDRLKREIAEYDKKVRQKQKEVVKAQRTKGRVLSYQKNISFLENRLNSSLHKYNQLLVSNKSLREDISSLLLTQSSFRRKYVNIKRLLAAGKKTLSEVVHSATVSYQTGESVKYKLHLIQERTRVDQKRLGEKIKELKIMVEQDKQVKEFLQFKMKDRAGKSDVEELSSKSDQILEHQLQACQAVLARVQAAAGGAGAGQDAGRVCKAFLAGEEENLRLFEKVNETSLEIEKLHEQVRAQRAELDRVTGQYKEQRRKDVAVKMDIENATDALRRDAQWLEDTADTRAEELECVKEVLRRIFRLLEADGEVPFTVDKGITDDNILQYLETMERRLVDVVHCHRLAEIKDENSKRQGIGNIIGIDKQSNTSNYSRNRKCNSCQKTNHSDIIPCDINYNRKQLEAFAKHVFSKEIHDADRKVHHL